MAHSQLLKKDLFGEIRLLEDAGEKRILRDTTPASPWVRWFARRLLAREARVLAALDGLPGIPQLERFDRHTLERLYVPGEPLYIAKPRDPQWFREAGRLLRRMHRLCVAHNDLAKEPNLLVQDDGSPAFVDYQLAFYRPRRGRLFRWLAYDDVRHLLKHKRTYCPEFLTAREQKILARPSLPSVVVRRTVKPVYLFVTRRLLGWADREGAADRGDRR